MDDIEDRLAAVERAVTGGDASVGELRETAAREAALADVREAVDELDERVAELEAATRALRGYAGGVRAVDEAVERRADLALARVERLERCLDGGGRSADGERPADGGGWPDRGQTEADGGEARSASGGLNAEFPDDGAGAAARPARGDPFASEVRAPADAAAALAVAGGEGADPDRDVGDGLRERFAERLRRAL